jgi:hypothetical protein
MIGKILGRIMFEHLAVFKFYRTASIDRPIGIFGLHVGI